MQNALAHLQPHCLTGNSARPAQPFCWICPGTNYVCTRTSISTCHWPAQQLEHNREHQKRGVALQQAPSLSDTTICAVTTITHPLHYRRSKCAASWQASAKAASSEAHPPARRLSTAARDATFWPAPCRVAVAAPTAFAIASTTSGRHFRRYPATTCTNCPVGDCAICSLNGHACMRVHVLQDVQQFRVHGDHSAAHVEI
jgi:hypothetical protein